MGSHHSKTGMLGWEGAMAVDGMHGGRLHWTKQGGPRAGCRAELVWWGARLWLPISAPCSMPICFLQHCLSPIDNRVAFAFWFAWFLVSGGKAWWRCWWKQGSFPITWRKWGGFSPCCVQRVPVDGIAAWRQAGKRVHQESCREDTSQRASCCYKIVLWACTHLLWVATRNTLLVWPDVSCAQTWLITFRDSNDTPTAYASVPWPRPGLGWDGFCLRDCVANHWLKIWVANVCLGVWEAALHWDDGSQLGEKGGVSNLEAEHAMLHAPCSKDSGKVAWQSREEPASSPETWRF